MNVYPGAQFDLEMLRSPSDEYQVTYTWIWNVPVTKEGIDEMAPTIGNAVGEIAKGIKKGLNDNKKYLQQQ